MVSQSDLLKRLAQQFSLYDEAAYTAITSLRLLRRAEKDLQTFTPKLLEDTGTTLLIDVDGTVVTLRDADLACATCSCPSSDICRHVLCACLWLAKTVEKTIPDEPELKRVLSYDDLKKWAGEKTLREAFQLLTEETPLEVKWKGYYIVTFTQLQIECRYYPDRGLETILCTCRSALPCIHRAAAVLAVQKRCGHHIEAPEREAIAEPKDTLKSRDEVISATLSLLENSVSVGICHLSDTSRERFVTLSISATGVNLPRLSQQLHTLADELQMLLTRNARADSRRLFQLLAETYALATALKTSSRADLIGWFKTEYTPVGILDLAGVGAYQWQSSSGYTGLTLLFWDLNAHSFCSWSDVRPSSTFFSPKARFTQAGPYEGAVSPQQLSQSRFKLIDARKNPHDRLSSSTETKAVVICPTDPERLNLHIFTEVAKLRAYARSHSPAGLEIHNPLTDLIAFRPSVWGEPKYDETTQTLLQPLKDSAGETICIEVPYTPANSPAIAFLEHFQPEVTPPHALIAYLTRYNHNLTLLPVSILLPNSPTPVISLSLQSKVKIGALEVGSKESGQVSTVNSEWRMGNGEWRMANGEWRVANGEWQVANGEWQVANGEWRVANGEWEELGREELEQASTGGLEALLAGVAEELQAIAERGVNALGQEGEVLRLAAAADEAGLSRLAGALILSANRPHAVLRAAYICQLYIQAASSLY